MFKDLWNKYNYIILFLVGCLIAIPIVLSKFM